MKFEYYRTIESLCDDKELDRLGNEGWELVCSVVKNETFLSTTYLIFKRPKAATHAEDTWGL